MAAVRELLVEFGVVVDDRDIKKATKNFDKLRSTLQTVGKVLAFVTGAGVIGAFITRAAAAGAAAGELAEQVGLSAEIFQLLNLAVQENGATVEDLRITLKSLAKNAQAVTDGSATMVKAFKDLGVEVLDVNGDLKSTDELLLDTGAALSALESPTARVAKAQTVLGEASLKLLPALNGTREELDAYLDSLRDLGGGFSQEAIDSSRKFEAAIKRLSFVLQGFAGEVIVKLTPAIEVLGAVFGKATKFAKTLLKETNFLRNLVGGGLFVGFIKAREAIVGFTRSIPRLIRLFSNFGLKGLIRGLGSFSPLLARIAKLLAVGARFARRFILPFLLLDDIFTFFEGGDSLIGRFIDSIAGEGTAKKFQDAIKLFTDGIKGFLTFLFADDPEAAAKALEQMKAAFSAAADSFKDFAGTFGAAIIVSMIETAKLFGEAWSFMLDDVAELFSTWITAISRLISLTWATMLSFISDLTDEWLIALGKIIVEGWEFLLADVTSVIKPWLDTISEVFANVFGGIWDSVLNGAKEAFAKVASFIPSGVKDFLGLGGTPGGRAINAGSAGGITSNQNIRVDQTINARAGQSPTAIAARANAQQGNVLAAANLRTLRGATQG